MRCASILLFPALLTAITGLADGSYPELDPKSISGEHATDIVELEKTLVDRRLTQEFMLNQSPLPGISDITCQMLSSEDQRVRTAVLWLLVEHVETTDLSRTLFCESATSFTEAELHLFEYILDRSQLFFMNHDRKEEILRNCLTNGSVDLWRGTVLTAPKCAGLAAWDGIPNLGSSIENAYMRHFSQREREKVSISDLQSLYELTVGSGAGWDQRNRAVGEVLEIESSVLARRLNQEEPFRFAVLALLETQCSRGWKTMCDSLRDGIDGAVSSVDAGGASEFREGPSSNWWDSARVRQGTFRPLLGGESQVR